MELGGARQVLSASWSRGASQTSLGCVPACFHTATAENLRRGKYLRGYLDKTNLAGRPLTPSGEVTSQSHVAHHVTVRRPKSLPHFSSSSSVSPYRCGSRIAGLSGGKWRN